MDSDPVIVIFAICVSTSSTHCISGVFGFGSEMVRWCSLDQTNLSSGGGRNRRNTNSRITHVVAHTQCRLGHGYSDLNILRQQINNPPPPLWGPGEGEGVGNILLHKWFKYKEKVKWKKGKTQKNKIRVVPYHVVFQPKPKLIPRSIHISVVGLSRKQRLYKRKVRKNKCCSQLTAQTQLLILSLPTKSILCFGV